MKHQLPAFLTGVAVTAMVFTCAPAIAAQIQTITASANTVNIALNGKQVAAKGENYTLANGTQVPYSLSYSGTTYLPIRKVGELVGQKIYWDGKTGTAGVGVNPVKVPETADYSTWTADEEKAYQEFKGMWTVEDGYMLKATYNGIKNKADFYTDWKENAKSRYETYCQRFIREENNGIKTGRILQFFYEDQLLTQAAIHSDGSTHCFITI